MLKNVKNLEPIAEQMAEQMEADRVLDEGHPLIIGYSIAASLKRIADAIDAGACQ